MADGNGSKLIVAGEMLIYGAIGMSWWDDYVTAKDVADALSEMSGDITVRVNSGGGSGFEGVAIHALLKDWAGTVTVKIDGIAASAASVIAMAGDRIVMADGALMMIHDASAVTVGKDDDHTKTAGLLTKVDGQIAAIYAARTGKTADEIRALMDAETWLDAGEAVASGFADETEEAPAIAASAFDYGLYKHAPDALATASVTADEARARRNALRLQNGDGRGLAVAPVAADAATTGQNGGPAMTDKTKGAPGTTDPAATAETEIQTVHTASAAVVETVPVAGDPKKIRAAVSAAGLGAEFALDLIQDGVTLDAAREKIIDKLAETQGANGGPEIVNAQVTADEVDRFKEGAEKAILAKAGLDGGERNEFSSLSLREVAGVSLDRRNIKRGAWTALDLVGYAFQPQMAGGMHSTSDFGNILGNVANKAMMKGYEEAAETFQRWTSTGSLSDFKTVDRVDINMFPSLQEVPEHAEFKYITTGDRKEQMVLATYGNLFAITRQAVINDDLGAFTRVPMRMGRAAIRTVGDLAYAVLTGNPTMGDGTALFHANHGNLASSGAAPSVTSFSAARTAMRTQTDRSASATALNIMPAYVLAPVTLEDTIAQVLQSEYDPAKTTRAVNTARGMVEPITDARLDAASATAWYFAANPGATDTVEVSYLDGVQTPTLEQMDGWKIDGTEFKVRIDAAAKALAWEGLYKDPGT